MSFHTHRVSEATRQAIRQLRTQGIKVFIATGRHLQVINNLGDLEFDGYVTLNGSCCYIGRDRVIYRRMIPEIALEHLIKYQEEKETFPCIFVREKDMFINYNNQHTREVFRMLDFPEPVVKDIHEATREGVFQLIAFFSEQQEDRIMQALPECEATRWNPLFTDVVPVGGNKSIGMEKILAYFGISREETMAFGDGGNDIPMLEYAGIGVAMGNASEGSAAARRFRYIRCRRRRYCTCLETFSYRRTLKVWVNSDFTSIRPRSLSVMLRRYRFKRLQGFQKLSQTLVRFARCHCLKQFP